MDSIFCHFSGSKRKLLAKFAAEPTLCETPVTVNGFFRDLQDIGDFLDSQAAEEPQFDDLALASVDEGEPFESVVDGDEVGAGSHGYTQLLVELERCDTTAALLGLMGTRPVHENMTHDLGAHSKEVTAVLPVAWPPLHEPKVGLVNECCRLQGVAGAFVRHVPLCNAMEFVVHERDKRL